MKTKNYVVRFYRKSERRDEKDTYLGAVELDDGGTGYGLTLSAKAFRQAPPRCLSANRVRIERQS